LRRTKTWVFLSQRLQRIVFHLYNLQQNSLLMHLLLHQRSIHVVGLHHQKKTEFPRSTNIINRTSNTFSTVHLIYRHPSSSIIISVYTPLDLIKGLDLQRNLISLSTYWLC
jgi:hypothetical protein